MHHPSPPTSQAPQAQNTAQGPRRPRQNLLDWQFLRRYCLSVSLRLPCLPIPDSKHKAVRHSVNAQKHKATLRAALKSAVGCGRGLACSRSLPRACFQSPQRTPEWRMGRHHPMFNPLCSGLPSCRFHPRNFLFNPWPLTESPCVLVWPSHAGCSRRDLPE